MFQNTDEARGLVVQAIQYYGVAGGEDKKLGHLQRLVVRKYPVLES